MCRQFHRHFFHYFIFTSSIQLVTVNYFIIQFLFNIWIRAKNLIPAWRANAMQMSTMSLFTRFSFVPCELKQMIYHILSENSCFYLSLYFCFHLCYILFCFFLLLCLSFIASFILLSFLHSLLWILIGLSKIFVTFCV